jgi:4-diphosphocytidyl-2-C-methyl-D-erythritol kinase
VKRERPRRAGVRRDDVRRDGERREPQPRRRSRRPAAARSNRSFPRPATRREPPSRVLRVPSFAKVNLGLEVLGSREDGYHELRTIFQTIDLRDDVVLRERPRDVTIRCESTLVPVDASNLAVRAALDLQKYARVDKGVEIEIVKRIPVGGGLGGGSSNAASVLIGLDRLWRLRLGMPELHRLARRLGADVPFFLLGGTALGLGRGDEVYPLWTQVRAQIVLVDLQRPVSTAAVFKRFDAGLTPRENSNTIFLFVSRDLEGAGRYAMLSNDLEKAAFEEAPELAQAAAHIRRVLVREGAGLAALSGSGSSFFGLFDDPRRARRAHAALTAAGFHALRVKTLPLDQYRSVWSRSLGRRAVRAGRTR